MITVLDTNVVVSGVLSATGSPAAVLRRWRAEQFEVAVSLALLAEYRRSLAYDRAGQSHVSACPSGRAKVC